MTTSYRPEIPNEAHLHLGFSFRSPSEAEKLGSARLPLLLVFSVFLAFRVCQFTFRQGTPPIWFDLRTSPVQAVAVACVWALIEEQEQAMPSSDECLLPVTCCLSEAPGVGRRRRHSALRVSCESLRVAKGSLCLCLGLGPTLREPKEPWSPGDSHSLAGMWPQCETS